jgi:very-short-patch-repair endonuclease
MAERRKLSLGQVGERAEERDAAEAARAWNVSPKRAEQLKLQARAMRRNPTEAQKALWERLRDKQCGFTFNREVVMGSAIVDFACKTRWLVVETGGEGDVDGTLATLSDRKLTDVGVRVLRFSDDQVLADTGAVVKAIKDELQKPFERPRIEARR